MKINHLSLIIIPISLVTALPAFAGWGKFTITDDNGEQVTVKHGLFSKKTIVTDRFGDGFEHKRTIFGLTKDTKVSAVGNDVHVHKGLFGFDKTEAQDMLGDTVTSHKNPLWRNTNVNLSGVNGVLNKYFGPKQVPTAPPVDPTAPRSTMTGPDINHDPNPPVPAP